MNCQLNPYLIEGPALISFSGGRTSGYMLKHILDAHGGTLPDDVFVAFANTGKEMPETLDFVQECSGQWSVPITWLEYDPASEHKTKIVNHNSASRNGEPFDAVIAAKGGMLPNPSMRYCTVEMKIRRFYMLMHRMKGYDRWNSVIGLRADEPNRVAKQTKRNDSNKERFNTSVPLSEAGVTKRHVGAWWEDQPFGLRLPSINGSTPEGNCDLCFLKGLATTRGIMRKHPQTPAWWVEKERAAQALEISTNIMNSDVLRFRIDRPSYLQISQDSKVDLFDASTYEDDRDCNCTD